MEPNSIAAGVAISTLLALTVLLITHLLSTIEDKNSWKTKFYQANKIAHEAQQQHFKIAIKNSTLNMNLGLTEAQLAMANDRIVYLETRLKLQGITLDHKELSEEIALNKDDLRILRNALHPDKHQGKHHELWVKINDLYESAL